MRWYSKVRCDGTGDRIFQSFLLAGSSLHTISLPSNFYIYFNFSNSYNTWIPVPLNHHKTFIPSPISYLTFHPSLREYTPTAIPKRFKWYSSKHHLFPVRPSSLVQLSIILRFDAVLVLMVRLWMTTTENRSECNFHFGDPMHSVFYCSAKYVFSTLEVVFENVVSETFHVKINVFYSSRYQDSTCFYFCSRIIH